MQTAIQQFKTVNDLPGDKEGRLYVSAHWYASLCYISMGKVDSALVELEKLKRIDNLFILEEKVEELKEDLKKSKWWRGKRCKQSLQSAIILSNI